MSTEALDARFLREIAAFLATLFDEPVTLLRLQTNPIGVRPCPPMVRHTIEVAARRVVITEHAAGGVLPDYAVEVDGVRVPFDRPTFRDPLSWLLARTVFQAMRDRPLRHVLT